MKTISRIQWTRLVIAFTIPFGLLFFLYIGISLLLFQGRILVERGVLLPVFLGNVVLSVILGWRYYRSRWHATLHYDNERLDLQVGKKMYSGKWQDFHQVSLFHLGYGNFSVRLYHDDTNFVEIPTSALRLDAPRFRSEAMRLIRGDR